MSPRFSVALRLGTACCASTMVLCWRNTASLTAVVAGSILRRHDGGQRPSVRQVRGKNKAALVMAKSGSSGNGRNSIRKFISQGANGKEVFFWLDWSVKINSF
jgi:hypothetical protein